MKVISGLRALSGISADICVVGSGPVGISVALEFARQGLSVVLLESGERLPNRDIQCLSDAEFTDQRHAPMSLAVCRALGGTSWLWGGRCVPLDAIDYEARAFISDSGWPIAEADVAPYYSRAADLLGCGPAIFSRSLPEAAGRVAHMSDGLRFDSLERWCDEPRVAYSLQDRPESKNISVILGVTATSLEFASDSGPVVALNVASRDKAVSFGAAKAFVLACGGLETARLLLSAQVDCPGRFGGDSGPLGRYYMGHISGCVADIRFSDPRSAAIFRYRTVGRSVERRRITLDERVQRDRSLPNVSFYPDNPRMSDPEHRSGVLSLIFLLLSLPGVGRRLISEPIRQMQMTADPRYLAHSLNLLLDLPRTVHSSWSLAAQRIIRRRRKPALFIESRDGKYPLHYHGEHAPHADSRVYLGKQTDALGMRRLRIELQYSGQEAEGIARAHDALDAALRQSALGMLEYRQRYPEIAPAILGQAMDGFHQIGTARMGSHPREGIVDSNCRVFGVQNLFIAGSAVFRTSGQANPTFPAVALGVRLATWLANSLKRRVSLT